jgi:hypothetical protein
MHGWYEYGTVGGGWVSLLITIVIVAAIFLICRELVCWYWKVNRAMALLERQTVLLERIEARISMQAGSGTGTERS